MSTTLEEIIDDLVKSWKKYKSETNEDKKLDAWVDTIIHLDSAMAEYLYEVSDTDLAEQTETATFVFEELSDRNPHSLNCEKTNTDSER